ncbi:DUF262 domain-containing protein [Mycoplasmopsis felis]|uniref:DUF262 domain-containing protein n=1 Tax=Mycoplasmopsis felis TaxID=33923 RepID=A0A809S170_9BACT|nr:DUF262 domain-containing protein [Mycoplasmopsis felis]BBU47867.1 hypothetical protein JPM2_5600 [Mycoplasmopsis felis]
MQNKIKAHSFSILKFFESLEEESKFLIPEYQRPYSWNLENITTFFTDLWEAYENDVKNKDNLGYFIGNTIVFKNNIGQLEVVDGQQRITTLLLLFRSIYFLLDSPETKLYETEEVKNLKEKLKRILWTKQSRSTIYDKSSFKIEIRGIDNKKIDILNEISEQGTCSDTNNIYCKNYNVFIKLIQDTSKNNQTGLIDFYYYILEEVNILKIEIDNLDTALTVFQTINNRGLQLSDSDIFKSTIYNLINSEQEKEEFINNWKELSTEIEENNKTFERILTYYMFYLRSQNDDISIRTPGLRRYFMPLFKNNKIQFNKMQSELKQINDFFSVINKRNKIQGQEWTENFDVLKELDIISSYPNEFWKYPVVCYYMYHFKDTDFIRNFSIFLKNLSRKLLLKYIEIPTSNAIKSNVLKLNKDIKNQQLPNIDIEISITDDQIKEKIINTPNNITRIILKLIAYSSNKQNKLLPQDWEIEHIIPQRWTKENHIDKKIIEMIGNKLPLEKKINVLSSDNILQFKFNDYKKSEIGIVHDFVQENNTLNSWYIENVKDRSKIISEFIYNELTSKLDINKGDN